MHATELKTVLEALQAGRMTMDDAQARILGSADLGYATLDLGRADRCGFPEVVFAQGKTAEWVAGAVARISAANQHALVTRLNGEQIEMLKRDFPKAEIDEVARTFWLPTPQWKPFELGNVLVVTAGTSDLPVAREVLVTAGAMGAKTDLIVDVGVAGIHRILSHRDRLAQATVVIVVAGMDGALPSVVGGLVDAPVIAVPTSVGYGASFGGLAALLTMLNSCSAGVATVNIDAGFKAGYLAARIIAKLNSSSAGPSGRPMSAV